MERLETMCKYSEFFYQPGSPRPVADSQADKKRKSYDLCGCCFHRDSNWRVSVTSCSRGSRATYSSTECSLTTPVETVKALMAGRRPLVSLPMKVGFIDKVAPRRASTLR